MSGAERPRAVLDSDVILSRVLHDLMGRLAMRMRLFDLVWSDELLDEAKRKLVERSRWRTTLRSDGSAMSEGTSRTERSASTRRWTAQNSMR